MNETDARAFWERLYSTSSPHSSGQPGKVLAHFASPMPTGRALDLGCAKGDDALWLARLGWDVLAVDISEAALKIVKANALQSGLDARVKTERHDLAESFPSGTFDLVVASFLYSPVPWPRHQVLARAAGAVDSSGTLLIIDHGSRAPWSWAPPDTEYPTPQDTLDALHLEPRDWEPVFVDRIEREATGPKGQVVRVLDNVIVLRRRAA